eukprot:2610657-Amphidinium_carterae.1
MLPVKERCTSAELFTNSNYAKCRGGLVGRLSPKLSLHFSPNRPTYVPPKMCLQLVLTDTIGQTLNKVRKCARERSPEVPHSTGIIYATGTTLRFYSAF